MKRIGVSIVSTQHPEVVYLGYALSNEVSEHSVSFFSTMKFRPDEELEVRVDHDGTVVRYSVVMTQLHEQISSGRIMNSLPDASHPFPARTFYRCFTKPNERVVATPMQAETATEEVSPIAAESVLEAASEAPSDTAQAA